MMSARSHRGFTILEMLVAIGITLALAGVMLSVTTGTLNVWRRVQGNFSASSQAKQVLDYLERDLQAALRRTDTNKWLAVEMPNVPVNTWQAADLDPGNIAFAVAKPNTPTSFLAVPPTGGGVPSAIADARFGFSGAWLRFFTPDSTGQPVGVSYQFVRLPPDAAKKNASHYLFFRSVVPAAVTFASGYDITASTYATPFAAPVLAEVLADHVVDFGVWLYVRDTTQPSGLLRVYPANATDSTRYVGAGNGTAATGDRFPEVADVMVRILTEEGAAMLDNLEHGRLAAKPAQYRDNDAWWWGVVEEHSQVFVRRVVLKGGGL